MSDGNLNGVRGSRRGFLRSALGMACGSASLSMAGGLLAALAPVAARAAFSDYRALVCVNLAGGNDGFNWLVPRDSTGHGVYAESRGALAIARGDLRPIATAGGLDLGLNPACGATQALFAAQEAAFVANCGVLMAPTTREDYAGNTSLPPALFSHNDQTDHWMSARPGFEKRSGWAGRLHSVLGEPNGDSPLAMNLSLAGPNLCQSGGPMPAYILGTDGAALIGDIHGNSANYYPYFAAIEAGEASVNALERSLATAMRNAFDLGEFVDVALADTPPPATPFDEASDIGRGLRMTAHTIAAHAALGAQRQVFFVQMGGYDTHDSQGLLHPQLLGRLDAAVGAFQAEMHALGLANKVTLFTSSEFGRTLTVNGDGTDHGWGSHHLVVGGAVRGGEVYGSMPDLTVDGPQDAGFGRIIPTTSTDQYLATLVRWFMSGGTGIGQVFPNLANFTPRRLGFLP